MVVCGAVQTRVAVVILDGWLSFVCLLHLLELRDLRKLSYFTSVNSILLLHPNWAVVIAGTTVRAAWKVKGVQEAAETEPELGRASGEFYYW